EVRAWRANEKALGKVVAANGSTAETNAYLNGQNKVAAYVKKFMDDKDWFTDAPVPPNVRAAADSLQTKFDDVGAELKDALNELDPLYPPPPSPLWESIVALGGAMDAVADKALEYRQMVGGFAKAAARVGFGFVPVVGTTLDFCEAVTGRAWCM